MSDKRGDCRGGERQNDFDVFIMNSYGEKGIGLGEIHRIRIAFIISNIVDLKRIKSLCIFTCVKNSACFLCLRLLFFKIYDTI